MLLIVFMVAVATLPLLYRLDPDFGWHLYLGHYMEQGKGLVHSLIGYQEPLSNIRLADHEWLSHFFFGRLYDWGGYGLLVGLSALSLLLICWLVYDTARYYKLKPWATQLTMVAVLLAFLPLYGVRIQMIFFVGEALLIWLPLRFSSLKTRRIIYFLIFLFGNNLHGGYLILSAIPLFLEWWQRPVIKDLALTMLIIGLALTLNPFGLDYWLLTKDYLTDHYYTQNIIEWRSSLAYQVNLWETFIPLIWLLFVGLLDRYYRTISWPERILLLLFMYLGIRYRRFWPAFVLLAAPYAAQATTQMLAPLKRYWYWGQLLLYSLILAWFLHVLLAVDYARIQFPLQPANAPGYPQAAMNYLEQQPLCRGATWNSFNTGGYIMGFYPDEPIFMDGRAPVSQLPSGQSLLRLIDSFTSANNPQTLEKLLADYHLRCALVDRAHLEPTQPIDRLLFGITDQKYQDQRRALQKMERNMDALPDWKVGYSDDLYRVYLRQTAP